MGEELRLCALWIAASVFSRRDFGLDGKRVESFEPGHRPSGRSTGERRVRATKNLRVHGGAGRCSLVHAFGRGASGQLDGTAESSGSDGAEGASHPIFELRFDCGVRRRRSIRRGFGSGGAAVVVRWFEEASADESDETIEMESSRDGTPRGDRRRMTAYGHAVGGKL